MNGTFARGNNDFCSVCGLSERQHIWRCGECECELPMGKCGCGAVHMPTEMCHGEALLHCPQEGPF